MTCTSATLRLGLLLTLLFTGGAPIGTPATRTWGVPAVWPPAGVLLVTLVIFVIDERKGVQP